MDWNELAPAKQPAGHLRWLMSFIDLVGVLVAFFVLMFAMKAVDRGKWAEFAGAMRGSFVKEQTAEVKTPDGQNDAVWKPKPLLDGLRYVAAVVKQQTGGQWAGKVVGNDLVFAVPLGATEDKLEPLMRVLEKLDNGVVVRTNPAQLAAGWWVLETAEKTAGLKMEGVVWGSGGVEVVVKAKD